MPRYYVYAHVVGTKYLGEFEADTPEEAAENGLESERSYISLCHHCTEQLSDDLEVEDATAELVEEED